MLSASIYLIVPTVFNIDYNKRGNVDANERYVVFAGFSLAFSLLFFIIQGILMVINNYMKSNSSEKRVILSIKNREAIRKSFDKIRSPKDQHDELVITVKEEVKVVEKQEKKHPDGNINQHEEHEDVTIDQHKEHQDVSIEQHEKRQVATIGIEDNNADVPKNGMNQERMDELEQQVVIFYDKLTVLRKTLFIFSLFWTYTCCTHVIQMAINCRYNGIKVISHALSLLFLTCIIR